MPRILIVEDEPYMQQGLKDNLEFEGYEVEVAGDGETGLQNIYKGSYDLIILDVMLPERTGFDVCKESRRNGIKTPILMLTAKGDELDKVRGLELGADDYVTKPFSLRELLARVKAILRRQHNLVTTGKQNLLRIGKLDVNLGTYQASINGATVPMTHLEFEVLKYLHQHPNEIVSRADLLANVWGYDAQPTTRTVDNFILKLRQKIEHDASTPVHILTVHGVGYKLVL